MTRTLVRTLDRIPPQNLEAEQSVLGCMLLDRDAIAKVAEALSPSDFYQEIHGTICAAILELFDRGEPADLVTVTNRLQAMGKLRGRRRRIVSSIPPQRGAHGGERGALRRHRPREVAPQVPHRGGHGDGLLLVGEGRVARDHVQLG